MMDAKTLEALEGSIGKWAGIVGGTDVDYGRTNCSLCSSFRMDSPDCGGCPVKEKTKLQYCAGSPYEDWFEHVEEHSRYYPYKVNCSECLRLAQAELDFLKSLLPEDSK